MINLIGKPFKDGARGPDAFDCWGLVMVALRHYGYELPDYHISAFASAAIGAEISSAQKTWEEITEPVPGCVVVMRFGRSATINHIGVYIGAGQFMHARDKTGVCIERVENPVFKQLIQGYFLPPKDYKR